MASMRGGRGRRFKSEINVVPYIDVMLVLLVIFMVAAPMATPGVINLPTAAKTSLPPTEYIHITMKSDANATIALGVQGSRPVQEETVARAALVTRLAALHKSNPEMPVMISAEKDIRYEEVIRVISDAKRIGINRVGLATRE
ncbi:MAG TPA: ExbD/TolR family protein [Noviherbaspirillum sp.]|nr:ExbD/TolR family protein [Noviherbaspirillum sp.]